MAEPKPSVKTSWRVFLALLVLLALTIGLSYLPLGRWGLILGMAIAFAKMMLIILFFMHVKYAPRLTWLFAAAGFIWFAILIAHTLSDYLTRGWGAG